MTIATSNRLWPPCRGPEDLLEIESVPLEDRGLPQSTYALLARAAELWPDRPAVSCLPDAERWQQSSTRTFAELAADVHRAAAVLGEFGIGRADAVAILSVNCEEMLTALLRRRRSASPRRSTPALAAEHATELVRLSGAKVIVAPAPELDAKVWNRARELAATTGARALLALRRHFVTTRRDLINNTLERRRTAGDIRTDIDLELIGPIPTAITTPAHHARAHRRHAPTTHRRRTHAATPNLKRARDTRAATDAGRHPGDARAFVFATSAHAPRRKRIGPIVARGAN
jgi:acyl-CoA synthetase (AMP-forming)/AMP-acid ligase II